MSSAQQEKVEIFLSYSRKDEPLLRELEVHLAALRREGQVATWSDRMLEAGVEWEPELLRRLDSAQVLLLLISPDFLASEFCWSVEMKAALARHEAGSAKVIPVILRACDWRSTELAKLQVLPKDGLPIRKWADPDDAFLDVVQGLRKALAALGPAPRRGPEPAAPPAAPAKPPVLEKPKRPAEIIESLFGPGLSLMAYSPPDNVFLATVVGQRSLEIFNRTGSRPVRTIKLPDTALHLVFSRDSQRLAVTLGGTGGVWVLRSRDGGLLLNEPAFAECHGADFGPGLQLATTSYDGLVRIFDAQPKLLNQVGAPGGRLPHAIQFSPDGEKLAVAFRDGERIDVLSARDLSRLYSAENKLTGGKMAPNWWSQSF
jgi:hypothetical protein